MAAASFNTVPAEAEPLVEKATTKTPWRRLVGSAAVVSFALGLVAAMAGTGCGLPAKCAITVNRATGNLNWRARS